MSEIPTYSNEELHKLVAARLNDVVDPCSVVAGAPAGLADMDWFVWSKLNAAPGVDKVGCKGRCYASFLHDGQRYFKRGENARFCDPWCR